MMNKAMLKKVGLGLAGLCLISFIGLGCATEEQVRAHREAAEAAAKRAEDAAARAEAAAKKAEAAAAKCEKCFQKSMQK